MQISEVWPGKEGRAVGVVVPKITILWTYTAKIDERLERLAPGPRRLKADERAGTLDGFIVVRRHRSTGATAIEALRTPDPTMKAYVDYYVINNGEKGPEARRCCIRLPPWWPFTDAFKMWEECVERTLAGKRDFLVCLKTARRLW